MHASSKKGPKKHPKRENVLNWGPVDELGLRIRIAVLTRTRNIYAPLPLKYSSLFTFTYPDPTLFSGNIGELVAGRPIRRHDGGERFLHRRILRQVRRVGRGQGRPHHDWQGAGWVPLSGSIDRSNEIDFAESLSLMNGILSSDCVPLCQWSKFALIIIEQCSSLRGFPWGLPYMTSAPKGERGSKTP